MDFTVLDTTVTAEGVSAFLLVPTGLTEDKGGGFLTVRCSRCSALLSFIGYIPTFADRCANCGETWAEYTAVK